MTQETALEILKTGANVFLTGEPGSGKTHTVNAYISYLREHEIAPSITASTGIAATHVGGITIHSWSGIAIRKFLAERDLDELESREPLVRRLAKARVLIIDEISMLDGKILSMVELVCRKLRHSEESFGGLQVILVGDFFQLPPIARQGEPPAQFCFDADVWAKLSPVVCYLTEQHRQEDFTFLATLGAIRRGDVDESVYECLEERRTEPEDHPEGVPRLHTHNVDVDQENNASLAKIEGDVKTFMMSTQGRPGAVETLKRGCLSPEVLLLKEGAAVMFTKNSFDTGYVNGTLGEVTGFDKDTGFPIVLTREGESITATPSEWAIEDGGKVLAKITQIPLRLAWAITVHKSQGMSMDAAIMDLSRAFEYGQGYVALSRVRSLSGLHLIGVNQRALEVHPLVLERDERFRSSSEEAEDAFLALGKDKLKQLHENFILSMGGKIKAKKAKHMKSPRTSYEKEETGEETLQLVLAGKTLKEITLIRELTSTTIVTHLEKMQEQGTLPEIDVKHFAEVDELVVDQIAAAFLKHSDGLLKPVFTALNERYSYELIRLVRMKLNKQIPPREAKLKKQTTVRKSSVVEKPKKLGAKWSEREEVELSKYYHAGMSMKEIAIKLERLPGGIRARLKKIGLVKEGAA